MQIADAHNDVLMSFIEKEQILEYIKFCKNNKVVKIFTAYYVSPEQESSKIILKDITQKFTYLDNEPMVIKSLENLGYVHNNKILDQIINLNPFCATLTWNHANILAGGAYSSGKLTEWGKLVVNRLNQNGIIIDTAHLNEHSFWDIVRVTNEPIFCSHCASREVYDIPRNFNKNQLRQIKKSNGYIGLCLYDKLLCDSKANFDTIRAHLSSFLEFAGEDHVGFGTDFNGTGEQNPTGIKLDYYGMQELYNYLINYFSTSQLQKFYHKNLLDFLEKFSQNKKDKALI